jgi:5-methylcytosine-specific restriction endonuclease McrA
MRKIIREPETTPDCLTKQVIEDGRKKPPVMRTAHELYTEKWVKKRKNNEKTSFEWYNNVNHDLLPLLKAMTCNHCSFCDNLPDADVIEHGMQIEHFKSKTDFEHLAYEWTNLFIICHICNNRKLAQNDALLLKPDEKHYEFKKHFYFDSITYEIIPKTPAAKITVEIYGLNRRGLCEARQTALQNYKNDFTKKAVDNYAFRDFLEYCTQPISFQDLLDL